jgi:hypothetical protein
MGQNPAFIQHLALRILMNGSRAKANVMAGTKPEFLCDNFVKIATPVK